MIVNAIYLNFYIRSTLTLHHTINQSIHLPPTRSNCDFTCASDNVEIVRSFFAKYPERRGSPFYIASESYGGHYIPEWTLQLFDAPDLLPYFKG
jgi:hypothetical protein